MELRRRKEQKRGCSGIFHEWYRVRLEFSTVTRCVLLADNIENVTFTLSIVYINYKDRVHFCMIY